MRARLPVTVDVGQRRPDSGSFGAIHGVIVALSSRIVRRNPTNVEAKVRFYRH